MWRVSLNNDPSQYNSLENYHSSPASKTPLNKSDYLNRKLVPEEGFEMSAIKGTIHDSNFARDSIFSNQCLCPYETTEYIYKELNCMNKQLLSARDRLVNLARENWDDIMTIIKNNHLERVAKRARESWYNSEWIDPNLGILQPTPQKRNEAWVKSQRKRFKTEKPILFPIERIPFYTGENAPILIENVYKRPKRDKSYKKSQQNSKKANHIFIIIHGMDSNYLELLKIKNEISLVTPNADFILPQWIAGKLSRFSIQASAQKVAEEIIETLENDYENMDDIGKI